MIRLVGILVGLGFTLVVMVSFFAGLFTVFEQGYLKEETAEHAFHLEAEGPEGGFAHDGLMPEWDLAQLQRGYQVYKEVCSACHSLRHVALRNLEDLGYNEEEIKAEAASWIVPDINPDTGEAATRPGLPTDYFPAPYANDVAAAAANNNAIPPDLSLITKARHHGPEYVYNLMTGYAEPSAELAEQFPDSLPGPGLYHNPYFANLNLAMAPPLLDGQVTYADGTEATQAQMATDVAAFLTWSAEPSLVDRVKLGWIVLGFLLFVTILARLAKKSVWSTLKTRDEG